MSEMLDAFLDDLAATADGDLVDLCRRRILHGIPFVFSGREDDYYEFRKRIAAKFKVNYHEIFITGSGSLGFSPPKRTEFSYDSDIDVAIVSPELFDRVMERIRVYQMELRAARATLNQKEIDRYHSFLEYTALGWIRPDMLPASFQLGDFRADWFGYFASISNGMSEVGNYKVSAGVYRSYRHLELYIVSGLQSVKRAVEIERTL